VEARLTLPGLSRYGPPWKLELGEVTTCRHWVLEQVLSLSSRSEDVHSAHTAVSGAVLGCTDCPPSPGNKGGRLLDHRRCYWDGRVATLRMGKTLPHLAYGLCVVALSHLDLPRLLTQQVAVSISTYRSIPSHSLGTQVCLLQGPHVLLVLRLLPGDCCH
jgi:hypothetical protein